MDRSDVQVTARPGIIELRMGHPDPDLYPARDLAEATRQVLAHESATALAYGAEAGPARLIEQLQAWLARQEGRSVDADRLLATGGSSLGLEMLCATLAGPGDTVLAQSPTYHLALRILRDHKVDVRPVPSTERGLDLDALEETLGVLARQGTRPKFLYLVPCFSNPSGHSLDAAARERLAGLARDAGFTVIEDDAYAQLWFESPPPPPLSATAPDCAIRLCSFSKILAPGLRLGWMEAPAETVQRFTRSGVLDSGGGLNHFTGHVVAAYMRAGLLDPHVAELRRAYAARRDALLAALAEHLPPGRQADRAGGGYYVWLRLPDDVSSTELLPRAEKAGVSFVPGARFSDAGEWDQWCRLCFAMLPEDKLAEGARRLGLALKRM